MSQLFDFSHILHASAGNYQATGSPFLINSTSSTQSLSNNNTSISQPLNLQDEIDQFLPDAGPSVDPLSPSLSSETTNVNASPSMQMTGTPFGFAPFDFLFSFPVNNSATVAPASISNTATVTPVAPGSPKDSADNSKAKSTRGRKPKVLSEGEKVAQEQHRKEKNKEFAQVSREKKRKHVEELEQTNVALSERVRQLEQANASLMSRVMELSGAANFVGSIFKSAPSATSSLGVPTTASQSSSTLLGGSGSSSGSGVARRSLVSTQFAASSSSTRSIFSLFWPFNVPHHSQQLYPLTAFFRRHVFGL
ncbi:hypothetical protein HK100_002627 [Physocladia obscura]|uniref:BZIP domain-containing protein n=1 Tax=Physocladia obscura TaxID=109957 RepID=A0AAD5SY86_9FUNG|nr:hypothetical protein HK100_002627 [Physocladia obscura]